MMKEITTTMLVLCSAVGCQMLSTPTPETYVRRDENRYVLGKTDEATLQGPYEIVEKVSATRMTVLKDGVQYDLHLRGCIGVGREYENIVKGSYPEDMGVYLASATVRRTSTNQIAAVVYRPANRVYVGMPKGYDNVSYVMPQLVHVVNGELRVDHSDTEHPFYEVLAGAERVAKAHQKGYWARKPGER